MLTMNPNDNKSPLRSPARSPALSPARSPGLSPNRSPNKSPSISPRMGSPLYGSPPQRHRSASIPVTPESLKKVRSRYLNAPDGLNPLGEVHRDNFLRVECDRRSKLPRSAPELTVDEASSGSVSPWNDDPSCYMNSLACTVPRQQPEVLSRRFSETLTVSRPHRSRRRKSLSPAHGRSLSFRSLRPRGNSIPYAGTTWQHDRDRSPSVPRDWDEDWYTLRQFSITSKGGVINKGDLYRHRSRSNNSVASTASGVTGGASSTTSCSSEQPPQTAVPKKVLMMGTVGVGKTSLVTQFMSSEYMNAYDGSLVVTESPLENKESNDRHTSSIDNSLSTDLIYRPNLSIFTVSMSPPPTPAPTTSSVSDTRGYHKKSTCNYYTVGHCKSRSYKNTSRFDSVNFDPLADPETQIKREATWITEYSETLITTGKNEEDTEKNVSLLLDGEEHEISFIDPPTMPETPTDDQIDACDAFVVVYSITDRGSFGKAVDALFHLREKGCTANKAVILVGNKSDLVRSRDITEEEAKSVACSYECKFIETSAAINHQVDELLVGIVTQMRLKAEQLKERKAFEGKGLDKKRSLSRMERRASCILNRLLGRGKQKSQSCGNLYVL